VPIYEYLCENGHQFEKLQKFNETLTTCPECGGSVKRVITQVQVQYKCGGFYTTDSK
jgi:putative FmdB family regulatory protein